MPKAPNQIELPEDVGQALMTLKDYCASYGCCRDCGMYGGEDCILEEQELCDLKISEQTVTTTKYILEKE